MHISSDSDYKKALRRRDDLMASVSPGHPSWEEYLLLTKAIEEYEEKNYISPSSSGSSGSSFDISSRLSDHIKR